MAIYETSRFVVETGAVPLEVALPPGGFIPDQLPQYLVINKATGVVEFCNTALYFVRDWADQMTSALDRQDWEIANPGKDYPDGGTILPFPGGKGGRTN
jgi:hypothetical protein